jgi:hypothetical protein
MESLATSHEIINICHQGAVRLSDVSMGSPVRRVPREEKNIMQPPILMKEPEIVICRICGEDFTDKCPEHGTREEQEQLARQAIWEIEERKRIMLKVLYDMNLFNLMYFYVNNKNGGLV